MMFLGGNASAGNKKAANARPLAINHSSQRPGRRAICAASTSAQAGRTIRFGIMRSRTSYQETTANVVTTNRTKKTLAMVNATTANDVAL